MKNTHSTVFLAVALWMTAATIPLAAADAPAPDAGKPNREELREKFKNMTPEERSAALKEWREKNPEAAAKMKDARQRRTNSQDLTPEEREAKLKQQRSVAEARVTSLQKKKTDGTITEQESRQLQRLEQMLKARPAGRAGTNKGNSNPDVSKPTADK